MISAYFTTQYIVWQSLAAKKIRKRLRKIQKTNKAEYKPTYNINAPVERFQEKEVFFKN